MEQNIVLNQATHIKKLRKIKYHANFQIIKLRKIKNLSQKD